MSAPNSTKKDILLKTKVVPVLVRKSQGIIKVSRPHSLWNMIVFIKIYGNSSRRY